MFCESRCSVTPGKINKIADLLLHIGTGICPRHCCYFQFIIPKNALLHKALGNPHNIFHIPVEQILLQCLPVILKIYDLVGSVDISDEAF